MKRLSAGVVGLAVAVFMLGTSAEAQDKKIERLWKSKCSSCHGKDGKAETTKGKKMSTESMATAEFQKKYTDAQLKKTTLEGIDEERNGVKKQMDGYSDLKPEEVDGLVAYIRGLGPK